MASSLSFLRSSLSSSLLFLRGRTRNEIQLLPQLQQQQIRWNWQVKIRQRLNPQTGEMEDIGNSRMWLAGADNRVQRKWPKHPSPRPWGVGWDSSVLCAQIEICTNQRCDSRVHLTWCFHRSWTLDVRACCCDFDLTLSLSNTLFILIIARFFIHDGWQTNKSMFIVFDSSKLYMSTKQRQPLQIDFCTTKSHGWKRSDSRLAVCWWDEHKQSIIWWRTLKWSVISKRSAVNEEIRSEILVLLP